MKRMLSLLLALMMLASVPALAYFDTYRFTYRGMFWEYYKVRKWECQVQLSIFSHF